MKRLFRPDVTLLESRLVLASMSSTAHHIAAKAAAISPAVTTVSTPTPTVTVPPSIATSVMTHLYRDILGRQPDPIAVGTVVPALQAGTTTAQLATALVTAPEFVTAHISATGSSVANETQYVTALYDTVLGRDADDAGVKAWVAALETHAASLAQVAAAIVNSPEAASSTTSILTRNSSSTLATNAFTHMFEDVLGRQPDTLAQGAFVPYIQNGLTMGQLAGLLLGSPEFVTAHISATGSSVANETQYVTALYRTMLGRDADAAGLAAWVNAIETHTVTLGQVAAILATSPEAASSSTSLLAKNVL